MNTRIEKVFSIALITIMLGNISIFAAQSLPKNSQVKQGRNIMQIYTSSKDATIFGVIGTGCTLAGLGLILYGKIQRNILENKKKNLQNNRTQNNPKQTNNLIKQIAKDIDYYKNYYVWGAVLGTSGLICLLVPLAKYQSTDSARELKDDPQVGATLDTQDPLRRIDSSSEEDDFTGLALDREAMCAYAAARGISVKEAISEFRSATKGFGEKAATQLALIPIRVAFYCARESGRKEEYKSLKKICERIEQRLSSLN
jgi:hypothetical protein